MTAKRILLALIVVTTLTFAGAFAAVESYQTAGLALALGLLWLIMEMHREQSLPSGFFLGFMGLALWGGLQKLPILLLLLCASTTLAAWDLARFRARIADSKTDAIPPALEIQHLRKLAATAVSGFVIALLPLTVSISVNFLPLAVLVLLMMLVLRRSILQLRDADSNDF